MVGMVGLLHGPCPDNRLKCCAEPRVTLLIFTYTLPLSVDPIINQIRLTYWPRQKNSFKRVGTSTHSFSIPRNKYVLVMRTNRIARMKLALWFCRRPLLGLNRIVIGTIRAKSNWSTSGANKYV